MNVGPNIKQSGGSEKLGEVFVETPSGPEVAAQSDATLR